MVDRTLPRPGVPRIVRDALPAGTLRLAAILALGLVAGAFAWRDPSLNGWAAVALGLVLVLEALSLMAVRAVARRGLPLRIAGLRSLVLGLGPGGGIGAALFAVALLAWPDGFPILATLLSGLVGMGAVARLALARIVLRAEEQAEADET
ncbi:hypothetical protein [Methylobacterium iners]|uniref:Uncharacterized protein n=1 Tax=Methylobacterium iners TaxID=418707 RepID=A0ABQ4RVC8_9HYPH|nr:hypothetical protein [Methylobacterium iners]GJD94330.1 hypothetical protein OCOJLMKI_1532 [Methylobacterium iners]